MQNNPPKTMSTNGSFLSEITAKPISFEHILAPRIPTSDNTASIALQKLVETDSYKSADTALKDAAKDNGITSLVVDNLVKQISLASTGAFDKLLLTNPIVAKIVAANAIKQGLVTKTTSTVEPSLLQLLLSKFVPAIKKDYLVQYTMLAATDGNRNGVKDAQSKPTPIVLVTSQALLDNNFNPTSHNAKTLALDYFDKSSSTNVNLTILVDNYFKRAEVGGHFVNPEFKSRIVKYLQDINLNLTSPPAENESSYDEYIALAYTTALKESRGGNDPINDFRSGNVDTNWNFQVMTFEDIDEQGVIPENILAAGALDYIFELGDHLGIFKLTDFLVLRWTAGALDITSGDIVSKLYRHLKLRDERSSEEERYMLYKRVLNKGEGKVMDRMVVNEDFTNTWTHMLEKVVEYIEKTEGTENTDIISKQGVYQAVKELQYNLTSHMTGMGPVMTREMYAHLTDCFAILNHPEIISQLATGARKNMWVVIENLLKSELKHSPNVSAFRTVAVKGNEIFNFIAKFNGASVTNAEFVNFKDSVESYIIAMSQLGKGMSPSQVEEDTEDEFDEDNDEF